jgi:hypothetical protein
MAQYSTTMKRSDHFQPESAEDPAAQRRMRGQLEKIDYTAWACNREVIGQMVGPVDADAFQRLAVACAQARATWVAEALAVTGAGLTVPPDRVARLAELRRGFEELSEAYEGMRRMVERGYLTFHS